MIKPIKVFFSPLSRRFYASGSYKALADGAVECTGERFDVTDDIADLIRRHEVNFVERQSIPESNEFKVWRSEDGLPFEAAMRRPSTAKVSVEEQRKAASRMVEDMYGGADD